MINYNRYAALDPPELVQLMAGSMYPLTSISQVLSSYNLVNAVLLSVSTTSAF